MPISLHTMTPIDTNQADVSVIFSETLRQQTVTMDIFDREFPRINFGHAHFGFVHALLARVSDQSNGNE